MIAKWVHLAWSYNHAKVGGMFCLLHWIFTNQGKISKFSSKRGWWPWTLGPPGYGSMTKECPDLSQMRLNVYNMFLAYTIRVVCNNCTLLNIASLLLKRLPNKILTLNYWSVCKKVPFNIKFFMKIQEYFRLPLLQIFTDGNPIFKKRIWYRLTSNNKNIRLIKDYWLLQTQSFYVTSFLCLQTPVSMWCHNVMMSHQH